MKKEKKLLKAKKGFTLIEMLVVVLIIGILAGIALPQYNQAVEKARLSEVLINAKAIEDSIDRYLLQNGFPYEQISFQDFGDIELSGGEWGDWSYSKNKYKYEAYCAYSPYCEILIGDKEDFYSSAAFNVYWSAGEKGKQCYTNDTDKGRFICKYLEPLGWGYIDDSW